MASETVPLDTDGFTAYMADRFRKAMPGYRIDIVGPLSVKLVPPEGDETTVSLGRALDYSASNRAECAQWLDSYVEKMRDSQRDRHLTADREMLRVVVRRKDYIDGVIESLADASKELVMQPLTDDLVAVCYVDLPTAMRAAMGRDLTPLGLNREEAMAQAKANLTARLAEFESTFADLDDDEIGVIDNDVYVSSWLALPEAWSRIAARFGGKLIVAVPAFDILLYTRESEPEDVDALRREAEETADGAEWPLSTSVYRWLQQGWQRL